VLHGIEVIPEEQEIFFYDGEEVCKNPVRKN
jgi:hypothetical protein